MFDKRAIILAAVGLCFLMLLYPPWVAVVPNSGGPSFTVSVGYEFVWNVREIGYEVNFVRLLIQWTIVAILTFLGLKYFAKP
jgi:hypothetical protein